MDFQARVLVLLTMCIINGIKAGPCTDIGYYTLDDSTRNVNYGDPDGGICDLFGHSYTRWCTCPLVIFSWLLDHVIYLELRKK